MKVYKYGDNVDTDVIIPARYLNAPDEKSLASHCMEDIDAGFASTVEPVDIIVAGANFGCGSSREHAPLAIKACGVKCLSLIHIWSGWIWLSVCRSMPRWRMTSAAECWLRRKLVCSRCLSSVMPVPQSACRRSPLHFLMKSACPAASRRRKSC